MHLGLFSMRAVNKIEDLMLDNNKKLYGDHVYDKIGIVDAKAKF